MDFNGRNGPGQVIAREMNQVQGLGYGSGLVLRQVGYEICEPTHSFGPAMRDYYLLHYVKRGKGIFEYGDTKLEVGAQEAFLIFPEELTYYEADPIEPWEYYWIGFYGSEAKYMTKMLGLSASQRHIHYKLEDTFSLEVLIKELTELKLKNESDRILEVAKLYELISWLRRNFELTSPLDEKENLQQLYMKPALDYLNRNFTLQISIENLADYIGINRTHLFRIFKEHIGMSPKEYLIQLRMKRAEELLRTSNATIKDITFSVGYLDPYLFSKMFKRFCGVSPMTYRAQLMRTSEI